jgi:para-aminobenzoate synthetase component I
VRIHHTRIENLCRPFAWARAIAERPFPVLLESALAGGAQGRYSILGWDPVMTCTCRGGLMESHDCRTGAVQTHDGDPLRALAHAFDPWRLAPPPGFDLPFAGGLLGYFSYDIKDSIEQLPHCCEHDLAIPEFVFGFYDRALIFDHERGVTHWVGPVGAEPDLPTPIDDVAPLPVAPVALQPNFSRAEYLDTVQRVKGYIAAGDIFQANISQRFSGDCSSDGLAVYSRLRQTNAAPFAAWLRYPDFEIISSSPERFLLLDGETVTTRPIKGTRPRRPDDAEFNRRMAAELLASAKDHAELAMIVDLERNDLGRVCSYGSVKVVEHAALEEYATVHHLVSTVRGHLHRPAQDEFSLIRAASPGGSITGAPKVRAMEIIEELEPHARGVYTGAIGYISAHGRMDLNIAIRTMVLMDGCVYVQVGGGIVADSEPQLEYEETLQKGLGMFRALSDQTHFVTGKDIPHV